MHLNIERSTLLRGLNSVTGVVERRVSIPILSHVLLRTSSDRLHMTATDLEREVCDSVPADIQHGRLPRACTVAAHDLRNIIGSLPAGATVELKHDADKGRLRISAASSKFELCTLAADDFPSMAAVAGGHTFEVPPDELQALFGRTKFAMSSEETRYYLNGVFLHVPKAGAHGAPLNPALRAVATDGHRLAQIDMPLPDGATGMASVIVPRKTVDTVLALLKGCDSAITCSVAAGRVQFKIGDIAITSKLIDGTYPDYARVIPAVGSASRLTVASAGFAAAVARVTAVASERGQAIKVSLSDNTLALELKNPEGGSANDQLEAGYAARPLVIGFNARYLADVITAAAGAELTMDLVDSGSPALVRSAGDDTALFVLMPMRA
jgi:DNA polymerase III subunit beta